NAKHNQYDFRTFNNTLNWTHTFTDDSNLRTVLLTSRYTPKTLFPERENNNVIEFESQINFLSLFSEYSKKINNNLNYYGGLQGSRYKIKPGKLDPGNGNS